MGGRHREIKNPRIIQAELLRMRIFREGKVFQMTGEFTAVAKFLIITGIVLTIAGIIMLFAGKIPYLGRLPGDIYVKKDNFVFFFPLVTSIIISVILTVILRIFFRK